MTEVVIQETEGEIPGSVEHPGIHYFCIVLSSWYCTCIGAGQVIIFFELDLYRD